MSEKDKKIEVKIDHHLEEQKKRIIKVEIEKGKPREMSLEALKSGGLIRQVQKDQYTVRLRCPGGRVPFSKLKRIAEVAPKYSKGDYVHLSVRQSIEIPYVDFHDFAPLIEDLKPAEQEIATCGPRVRVPTACSGCEYNPNGLIDVQKLCKDIDKRFFGITCNHKFKMSLSGCPIDCFRTNEMDLGIQGAIEPEWEENKCTGCRVCGVACHEGAITNDEETGTPTLDRSKCLYCADCIRVCPTEAWVEGRRGCVVRVGGKHGRHPLNGAVIAVFLPETKLFDVIEKIIDWYHKYGQGKGRIRIGDILRSYWDEFVEYIKPVLGEYAVDNPQMPEPMVTHPYQAGWKPPEFK